MQNLAVFHYETHFSYAAYADLLKISHAILLMFNEHLGQHYKVLGTLMNFECAWWNK